MAIEGIIENTQTWVRIVDPESAVPPRRNLLLRLFSNKRTNWRRKSVSRGDFLTPEVSHAADSIVRDIKSVASSQTVAQGYLGDPNLVTRALVTTLYRRLVEMLSVDEAVMQAQDVRAGSGSLPEAVELISQMEDVVADSLETNVRRSAEDIGALTDQIKLLDLQLRMPEMKSILRTQSSESLESVSAQISALCDLPIAH